MLLPLGVLSLHSNHLDGGVKNGRCVSGLDLSQGNLGTADLKQQSGTGNKEGTAYINCWTTTLFFLASCLLNIGQWFSLLITKLKFKILFIFFALHAFFVT